MEEGSRRQTEKRDGRREKETNREEKWKKGAGITETPDTGPGSDWVRISVRPEAMVD